MDVLFEAAAIVYGNRELGAVVTVANEDGAERAEQIRVPGGVVIAQDPSTLEHPDIPGAALQRTGVGHRVPVRHILQGLRGEAGP